MTAKKQTRTVRCRVCSRSFPCYIEHVDRPDLTCGFLLCRARATWTLEEWADARRLAEVRRAVGIELNDLDLEALSYKVS